jgi:quercetin dioxygenase-like cupin family protein
MATQLKSSEESWDAGERATVADTPYTRRARYFDSSNAFALKYPPVPCHQFLAERDRALDPATGTAVIPLDLSDRLGTDFAATTPLILTRYLRIRNGADRIGWGPGDVFCLPGGAESAHVAGDADCVLWLITNEPELAFEHLEPPTPENAVTGPVHYPAAEIALQLQRVGEKLKGQKAAGLALVFSSAEQARSRNVLPSLTLAVNQLPPGDFQRPHRHNSAAVTLCLQGKNCYSLIGGRRVDWQEHAVMVTPPGDVHSHHNDGDEQMTCLIVQDGGLYYHCRTMGFAFAD